MANRILVSVEEGFPVPGWLERVEPFLQRVMELSGYDGEEVSVLFCSDTFIRELNATYRQQDAPTDVLSFENGSSYTDEQGQEWLQAGDIAISLEMLPTNAAYFAVGQDEELKRLLIHGLLHLNGYDHGEEHIEPGVEPVCPMLRLQKKLLGLVETEAIIG